MPILVRRETVHFVLFLALLALCALAGQLCAGCSDGADDAPVTPVDGSPDAILEVLDGSPDSLVPDAVALPDAGAFTTCEACWEALGFDDGRCAMLPVTPYAGQSGYRTCGQCVALYSIAECAQTEVTP